MWGTDEGTGTPAMLLADDLSHVAQPLYALISSFVPFG